MSNIIEKLRSASAVIGNLPELPNYNGSILTIDDEEAETIAKDIYIGSDLLEKQTELIRLIFESTVPYDENGACVFSDKVLAIWKEVTE